MRLPLDIQFVFTANPEDYTNRGSIVTPLKDRIESQILTHYPKSIEIGKKITQQEAFIKPEQKSKVKYHELAVDLIEQIAQEARKSEFVDVKSGVSARLTISAMENLISSAERRAIINGENETFVRMADFWGVIPSITGKIELVYEGEQEGPYIVAQSLVGKAIRSSFLSYFPDPEKFKKKKPTKAQLENPVADKPSPYLPIVNWFGDGNKSDILIDFSNEAYVKTLKSIPGLQSLVEQYQPGVDHNAKLFFMEFALHGLAEYSLISKGRLETGHSFKDLFSSMFNVEGDLEEE